jgi:hypothetical protein
MTMIEANRTVPLALDSAQTRMALGNISKSSLRRLVRRGLLKPSLALRKPLFSVREIERFLRETSGGGKS